MNVELQARIIKQATRMFMCNGIKSITMDMIASQLGISKRTRYENFKDKDELAGVINKLNNIQGVYHVARVSGK